MSAVLPAVGSIIEVTVGENELKVRGLVHAAEYREGTKRSEPGVYVRFSRILRVGSLAGVKLKDVDSFVSLITQMGKVRFVMINKGYFTTVPREQAFLEEL